MAFKVLKLPLKIIKIIVLCGLGWYALNFIQFGLDMISTGTKGPMSSWQYVDWQLHQEWWAVGPLWALIVYLVFSEKI